MASRAPSDWEPKGDEGAFEDLQRKATEASSLQSKGMESIQSRKDLERTIESEKEKVKVATNSLARAQKEVKKAEEGLKRTKAAMQSTSKQLEEIRGVIKEQKITYDAAKDGRDAASKEYHGSIPKSVTSFPPAIADGSISSSARSIEGVQCFALGDIHGWAPGLLAFLLQVRLATVTINGETCKTPEDLRRFFPNPLDYDTQGTYLEGPWIDGSPFFPPEGGFGYRGQILSLEVNPTKGMISDSFFLQVGDLIDRGDYSELALEGMRQMVVKSAGRCVALIGNHEGFIVDKSRRGWLSNERNVEFNPSKPGIAGTMRLHKKRAGCGDLDDEAFFRSVFDSYSAHLAHLLLSQEYSLRSALDDESSKRLRSITQPSLDLLGIDDEELGRIATSGGWDSVRKSKKWIDEIWKTKEPMAVAGALCLFSVGDVLGLHAESTALLKIGDGDWEDFSSPFTTEDGGELRMLHYVTKDRTREDSAPPRYRSLLWSRDKGTHWGLREASAEVKEAIGTLRSKMPWISHVFHGHTPQRGVETLTIPTKKGYVKVTNLDWSFTPPYLSDKGEGNPYSVTRKVLFESKETMMRAPRIYDLAKPFSSKSSYSYWSTPLIEGQGPGRVWIGDSQACTYKISGETLVIISHPKSKIRLLKIDQAGNALEQSNRIELELGGSDSIIMFRVIPEKRWGRSTTYKIQQFGCFIGEKSHLSPQEIESISPPLLQKLVDQHVAALSERAKKGAKTRRDNKAKAEKEKDAYEARVKPIKENERTEHSVDEAAKNLRDADSTDSSRQPNLQHSYDRRIEEDDG